MQTKLGLFCDKVIETGWLTAAIITPLFFNWYSNRIFEASKVALLRSITLLMLASWLIKVLETGNGKRKARLQYLIPNIQSLTLISITPLSLPSLLVVATYILTTITSISPRVSFWGSYQRQQGLYVVLCYIAIFLLMLKGLRTRQQLERLITVILLTSLPISLYGIMQHYRVDPLVWTRGAAYRVESTLGNPIFIGAYLIMVIPLTVWQLIRYLSAIRAREKGIGASIALFGLYLLLLFLQLLCLVFTQSRGPVMGFLAGAFFFLLLLAVLRRKRGLALVAVGGSIVLLAILVMLNLPQSPVKLPQGIPYAERLTRISRDIIYDRSLIWQGAINMVTGDKVRAIVGYGPETMGLIFYRYMLPDWAARLGYTATADRSHNETLDVWVAGGLVGLAAYLVLFGSIFYYGLKGLGLIANSRQRTFFAAMLLAGAASGVLIPWLVGGTLRWAGVGIPAGMLLALVLYLMTALFQSPKPEFQFPASNFQMLFIALFSALIAHFVEIQFGIAITATRTYFWLYAALLVIIGYQWRGEPVPEAAEVSLLDSRRQQHGRRRRERRQPQISRLKPQSYELLANSLLAGLVLATTSFDLIIHQFDRRINGPPIFGLLAVTWLFGAIPILTSNIQYPIPLYALASLLSFLPFLAAHAAIILPGVGVERANIVYYAYVFLVIFAVATALTTNSVKSSQPKVQSSNLRHVVLGFGIWMLSFLLIFNTNLKMAQADIYYKFALSADEAGEIDKAIALHRHAIQLTSRWDQYYSSLGWDYGLKAIAAADAHQRAALFEESLKTLEQAQRMNPFDPDIEARLGHVYWNWGGLSSDMGQRAERLESALAHYQRAVTLSPLNHAYQLKDNIVQTYLHLGAAYTSIGKLDRAVEAYQKALEKAPDNYEAHKGLALVYQQLGRLDEALEEAKKARDLAPEEKKPALDELITQLGVHKK